MWCSYHVFIKGKYRESVNVPLLLSCFLLLVCVLYDFVSLLLREGDFTDSLTNSFILCSLFCFVDGVLWSLLFQ